jgi:hypothetical protein
MIKYSEVRKKKIASPFYIQSISPNQNKREKGKKGEGRIMLCYSYFIIPKYGHLHTTLFKVNDDNYTFKYKVIN